MKLSLHVGGSNTCLFTKQNVAFEHQFIRQLEYKTLRNRNGEFMFRDFLGKMECKKVCLFFNLNNLLATKMVFAKRASDQ